MIVSGVYTIFRPISIVVPSYSIFAAHRLHHQLGSQAPGPMGQIKGKIKHPWASRLGLSCFLQVKTLIYINPLFSLLLALKRIEKSWKPGQSWEIISSIPDRKRDPKDCFQKLVFCILGPLCFGTPVALNHS